MTANENQKYFSVVGIQVGYIEGVDLNEVNPRESLPFSLRLEIENTTDCEVLVGTRHGITYAVKPTVSVRGNRGPGILIRNVISGNRAGVRIDVSNQLNDPVNEDQKVLLKSISGKTHDSSSRLVHGLDYFIPKERIDSAGGVLYAANLDLQLSIRCPAETPEHPFSQPGIELHSIVDNDFLNSKNHIGISMKLIDNANMVGDRYVNLGGTIFQVKATKDVSLPDGLYVVLNGVSTSGSRAPRPAAKFYPLEDIAKLYGGMYRTVEEAISLGDLFKQEEKERSMRETELKNEDLRLKNEKLRIQSRAQEVESLNLQAKAELEVLVRDRERLKHEKDTLKLEYERRLEELQSKERELEHIRKMESMRRSDYYDERSSNRKDISENTKLFLQITAQVVIGIVLPYLMKSSK